jgi:23S rRNA (uracil1939-C5)-methyltransferase
MPKRRRRPKKARNPAERFLNEALHSAGAPNLAVPDCAHQQDCGGCTWQRIPYADQLAQKAAVIHEVYAEAGHGAIELDSMLPSPSIYGYRNHMEFSFAARRWLTRAEIAAGIEVNREFSLGLHVPGGVGRVMRIARCSLQSELANRALAIIEAFARDSGEACWSHREHTGYWRFLKIRSADAGRSVLIGAVTARRDAAVMSALAEALRAGGLTHFTLANGVTDRVADTSEGAEWHLDAGPEFLVEKVAGLEFEIAAESFFQPNTETAGMIFGLAAEMAAPRGGERVLDLFSGTGTLSLVLAQHGAEVTGLELVEASVAAARRNAERNGMSSPQFAVADLLRGIPEDYAQIPWDVVVTDPPRAGMHPKTLTGLISLAPPRIVSVGCNPKTQARDLARLVEEGDYRITRMVGVDQFPHTPHVECLTLLERGRT